MRFKITTWISALALAIQLVRCNDQPPQVGPKDYTFVAKKTRVSDLVNFFESMRNHNEEDPLAYRKVNTMISLSEAATKLHTLSDSYPLEVKCDKYVKLISKPDIRTFATVNELMKESKLFSETLQVDANLVSRIQDERTFDALGRMQTILQSLESEKTLGVSNYELIVQKQLLDCVNYYVYRHQRATFGVVNHVRDSMDKLPRSLTEYGGSEVLLRKFRDSMGRIKELERQQDETQFDHPSWINELSKVHELVIENNFEIPFIVHEFISDATRLDRLNLIDQALERSKQLMERLVELENERQIDISLNPEYEAALDELYDLYSSYKDIMTKDIKDFVENPQRWEIIQDGLKKKAQQVRVVDEGKVASLMATPPPDHLTEHELQLPTVLSVDLPPELPAAPETAAPPELVTESPIELQRSDEIAQQVNIVQDEEVAIPPLALTANHVDELPTVVSVVVQTGPPVEARTATPPEPEPEPSIEFMAEYPSEVITGSPPTAPPAPPPPADPPTFAPEIEEATEPPIEVTTVYPLEALTEPPPPPPTTSTTAPAIGPPKTQPPPQAVFMTSSEDKQRLADDRFVRMSKRKANLAPQTDRQKRKMLITETSKQKARVKAGASAKQTITDKKVLCNKLSDQFKLSLQSFNAKSIDLDKAKMFTQDINNFSNVCSDLGDKNKDGPSSNKWPMLSLATKISIWAKSQVRNPNLTDENRAEIMNLTHSLRKIVIHN